MSPATGALLIALVLSVAVTRWVPVPNDEAWFLHVVRRVQDGDRLYEDVFFGAAPLPVWMAGLAVRWSRPQVVVIRALTIGYAFAIWVAGVTALGEAGAGSGLVVLFVIGALALGGHHLAIENQYGQVSTLGVIMTAIGILAGAWPLTGIGLVIALSGKYSLGIYGAAWALPLLWISSGVAAAAGATAIAAFGVAIVALILGPAGVRSFYATAVANKRTYLSVAGINPIRDLQGRIQTPGPSLPYRVSNLIGPIAVVIAAGMGLAAIGFALIAGVSEGSTTLLLAAGLCATGLAVAYPRADFPHLVAAMPLVLLGLILIMTWADDVGAIAVVAGAALLVVLAGTLAAVAVVAGHAEVRRDLPRLRLLPVTRQRGAIWPDDTDELRAIAGDEVFLLRLDASFFYLAGRLSNPTSYDYPLRGTFGPNGQADVAAAIQAGTVRWICSPGPVGSKLAPTELEALLAAMTPMAHTPVGDLYDTLRKIRQTDPG